MANAKQNTTTTTTNDNVSLGDATINLAAELGYATSDTAACLYESTIALGEGFTAGWDGARTRYASTREAKLAELRARK